MSMKILIIGKYYYPFSGGMETLIQGLAEGFSDKGHNVRVICSNTSSKKESLLINNVRVTKYPRRFSVSSQAICPSLFFAILKLGREADIIHIHSPNPLYEFACLFLPKNKIIVSTHHSDIFRQKFIKKFYLPFWKKFTHRLNKIIVPTENHFKFSDMINNNMEKISVIPFGIKVDAPITATHFNPQDYGRYVLFVGRLVEYKGIEYLLEALKAVEVKCVIVGTGPLYKTFKTIVDNDDLLKDKVHLLGKVAELGDLYNFYINAFAFCLPSITKNENFGIVQLEAMKFALPIIASNLESGVSAVGIANETTLNVQPKSSKDIQIAIQKLLDNPELAKKMGENGQKLFLRKYTYDMMIEKHEKLFISLLNEKK